MVHYKNNLLPKKDLAQTLRAYQASSDLMKSKERDDAQCVLDEDLILGTCFIDIKD